MDGEKQVSTTPALNLPSFRISFESQLAGLPPEVQAAHRTTFNALTDIYQSITALNSKVEGNKSSIAAVTQNVNTASETVVVGTGSIAQNVIGFLNNKAGVTSYSTLPNDYGACIILSDSSPVAVSLTGAPVIQLPWYCAILNEGTGLVTVTPASGTISFPGNLGAASMPISGGQIAFVWFDGTNFTADVFATAGSGVTQIVAGTNVTISPVGGTGAVTVNATGSGVTSLNSLTGALSLTSTGSSVSITPSGSTIDLEISGGAGFTSGSNTNGAWVKDPTNTITQRGVIADMGVGDYTVTFPIPFTTTTNLAVDATAIYVADAGYVIVLVGTVTITGFSVHQAQNNNLGMSWIAIGN